jgi:NADH dehydrogenase
MADSGLNVITGAFGYTGRHIANLLLAKGKQVKTITNHPDRPNPFGNRVTVAPYSFDDPAALTESLKGADILFNTYWIRFSHGRTTFDNAVTNSKTLIKAAEDAGVRRIVHISITNPSSISPLPYYKGKAEVEEAIIQSKLTYVILRPNVLFGDEGILINNIAYLLRHFPIFVIPGSGEYQIQPIYVDDLAKLAVNFAERNDNVIIDAVGPEIYTFNDLVALIAEKIGRRTKIIHLNPGLAYLLASLIGRMVGDVVLTRDEVEGLLRNLLVSNQKPAGPTKLSNWLTENASWIGTSYMSEIKKHYR